MPMKNYLGKIVLPVVTLAIAGAFSLLIIYFAYDYMATGDISLKWYDFTEPGTAIEITVSNLLLVGALSGLITGGMARLLGIQLTNRVRVTIALGIASAVVVALLFGYFLSISAYEYTAPGG